MYDPGSMARRKANVNVARVPISPATGYLNDCATSVPFRKLPCSSPEKLVTPHLPAAIESSGARRRTRITVFGPAMPRYSAVT